MQIDIKKAMRDKVILLKRLNLCTQKELANAVGVTEQQMSYVMNGKRNPSLRLANAVLNYMHEECDYLIDKSKA